MHVGRDRLVHPPGDHTEAKRGERNRDQSHQLHVARLGKPGGDDRDREHRDSRRNADHGRDAEQARAFIVVGRQHRRPRALRQPRDRGAEIEHEQPDDDVGLADARLGHEQLIDRQHQDWRADEQPQAIAADGGPRPVHENAEDRIDGNVDQAHERKGAGDDREPNAQVAGEVARKIDSEGDPERAHGDRGQRERQDGWQSKPPRARCLYNVNQWTRSGRSPPRRRSDLARAEMQGSLALNGNAQIKPPRSSTPPGSLARAGWRAGWRGGPAPRA